jgi:hypothetical protein
MKTKSIVVKVSFLILLVFLISCDRNEEVEETFKPSGNLTANYLDNNGNALSDIKVKLISPSTIDAINMQTISHGGVLTECITNNEGLVDFGELTVGNYELKSTATINDIKYVSREWVNVVAVNKNIIHINPQESLGEVNLSFRFKHDYIPKGTSLKVVLIDNSVLIEDESLREIVKSAEDSATVNDESKISFTLPTYRHFRIYTYVNIESDKYLSHNRFSVSKGSESNFNVLIDVAYYGI